MDKRLNFYTHLDIVGVAAETPCHEKRERNMLHWVVRKMHSHKQSSSRQAYAWMKNRVVATNTCSHHGVAHRVNFETDRKSYWFSLFFFSFARGSLQWRKRRRRSLHQQQIKNYDNTHVTNKQRRIKKKKTNEYKRYDRISVSASIQMVVIFHITARTQTYELVSIPRTFGTYFFSAQITIRKWNRKNADPRYGPWNMKQNKIFPKFFINIYSIWIWRLLKIVQHAPHSSKIELIV